MLISATGAGGLSVEAGMATLNASPQLDLGGGSVTYQAGQSPVLIAPSAVVTDSDSATFDGGHLWASVTTNLSQGDRISLRNEGTGAEQVGLSGTQVSFGGVEIGTLAPSAFVVTLNENATVEAVEAVIRNIEFSNRLQQPASAERTLRVQVTDGTALRRATDYQSVNVRVPNELQNIPQSQNYYHFPLNVVVAPDAVLANAEASNLDGARLWIAITDGNQTGDRLKLVEGRRTQGGPNVSVIGDDIRIDDTVIGRIHGPALSIEFTDAATPENVQEILRRVSFWTVPRRPVEGTRTVRIQFADGDSPLRSTAYVNVNVVTYNDVANFDGVTNYLPGCDPVLVDDDATVVNAPDLDFDRTSVTFQITENLSPGDRLRIRHEGTGPGLIGWDGSEVTYGGIVIGKTQFIALKVEFNDDASLEAINAVIQRVEFLNTEANPSTLTRTVELRVVGRQRVLVTKQISVGADAS